MNIPGHADYLRKLCQQLAAASEECGKVKAELANLKGRGKKSQSTDKRKKLQRQVQQLSSKIEKLIEAIGQPAPRRAERWSGVMPVLLLVESGGKKIERIASTADFSQRGLRIRTIFPLAPGQIVDVYSREDKGHLGHCRVVWVAEAGSARPGEVGLEILA